MPFKDAQSSPKSRRHLNIPDASYVTWRQFHTEDPTISRHCRTKYSPPGDLPSMICATLMLLKTIFQHNSMHIMLQVHRTTTERRWSASHESY